MPKRVRSSSYGPSFRSSPAASSTPTVRNSAIEISPSSRPSCALWKAASLAAVPAFAEVLCGR